MKKDKTDISDFLLDYLEATIEFCWRRGIKDAKSLSLMKSAEIIDHALWKLLELDGKYNQRFISIGVHAIEKRFDVKLGRSGWPKPVNSLEVSDKSLSIQLEHVLPKKYLSELLLTGQLPVREIQKHLRGCVVLKAEHDKLNDVCSTIDDPWGKYLEAGIDVYDRSEDSYLFGIHRINGRKVVINAL